MHHRLLTTLALAVSAITAFQAQASDDDSCAPTWSVNTNQFSVCSNFPFLSPSNDSTVNLRLLLADSGKLPLTPAPLGKDDIAQGYGEVPFAHYRLQPPSDVEPDIPASKTGQSLDTLLNSLGIKREQAKVASSTLIDGEGSRCRSNSEQTAADFMQALADSADLSPAERSALGTSRLRMLAACTWEPEQFTSMLPGDMQSAASKSFATYLQAASDFYSGRFLEATSGFTSLADNSNPWLKDTSLYMIGRSELNLAQEKAFEYGELKPERVDKAAARRAEEAFDKYLELAPSGLYCATANGLLRRVHWLLQDTNKLAAQYEALFADIDKGTQPDSAAYNALIRELDLKLITPNKAPISSALITAVNDLMWMRVGISNTLTSSALLEQKDIFAKQPELFSYLQAAVAFYTEKDPTRALQLLPAEVPDTLGYVAFSQQMLRGLALEASKDDKTAQQLWLHLLSKAQLPLQQEQLQWVLAMNYERNDQVAEALRADSPIKNEKVRYILLSKSANADLLRQQITQGPSTTERDTALFLLLYKQLVHGQYAAFGKDLKQLPDSVPDTKLSYSLGYQYDQGHSLALFKWNGNEAASGYRCPSLAETAAALDKNPSDSQGLICMGEFMLRNHLDAAPLNEKPTDGVLGSGPSGFPGESFARHSAYVTVINDAKAAHTDVAYALYRAINCYGPAGINSCGAKDVEPNVRKLWFQDLKKKYADTRWAKSQQYYW
ncbi:outer membrane assembly lipoprotein YfiO [Pseudomonas sp. nanlin1]|uniref:outer membrane assembly lipoprotein YfiO n=1 Tax=Pseudomonas sp. nanlin1 TaxID=3040605 RepID=UPI00388F3A9B